MIKWGMLGTGDVTEVKSGPAFYICEGSSLHAVYNRTHNKAVDYARRHKVAVVHEHLDQLLKDPNIDAFYVATPPSTHKELALKVIATGKPLCLEKPMAMNREECDVIIEASRKNNVPVYVTYYRRNMEKFLKIKELLTTDAIGKIGTVQVSQYQQIPDDVRKGQIPWRFNKDISGGGILVDMGSHVFDILDFLIAPITSIAGFCRNYGGYYPVEDLVSSSFLFDNNIVGTAIFNFNADSWVDRIAVTGEKGRLIFSCFDDAPVEIHTGKTVEKIKFTAPSPVYAPFVLEMVNRINSGDTNGYAETAVRPTDLIDQLLATYNI